MSAWAPNQKGAQVKTSGRLGLGAVPMTLCITAASCSYQWSGTEFCKTRHCRFPRYDVKMPTSQVGQLTSKCPLRLTKLWPASRKDYRMRAESPSKLFIKLICRKLVMVFWACPALVSWKSEFSFRAGWRQKHGSHARYTVTAL